MAWQAGGGWQQVAPVACEGLVAAWRWPGRRGGVETRGAAVQVERAKRGAVAWRGGGGGSGRRGGADMKNEGGEGGVCEWIWLPGGGMGGAGGGGLHRPARGRGH